MRISSLVATSLFAAMNLAAEAQQQQLPHRVVVEATAGAAVPADSSTRTGFSLKGAVKVPMSPSWEIGIYGGAWSGRSDFGSDSKESYIGGTVERNWTWGSARPFISGGVGVYNLKFQFESRNRFAESDSESRVGGFAGAGIQVPVSRGWSVLALAEYHLTSGPVNDARSGFLNVGAGIRAAF